MFEYRGTGERSAGRCHRWMARLALGTGALLLILSLVGAAPEAARDARPHAVLMEVEGVIGPAIDDYLRRSLRQGVDTGATVAIVRMDTPGGLVTTTRSIVLNILESEIPVVVYVAPEGARATSAGTFILYAAHIAAMAPATHVGSATPVQMGGGSPFSPGGDEREDDESSDRANDDPMSRKIINDAVAYIQSLAELRGRNAEWAEAAVREGESLTSTDALEANVIDVIAPNVESLLESIHGRTVTIHGRETTLETDALAIVRIEPDWRTRLLAILGDPNVGYILMMIGIYGLIFELSNPGTFGPGIAGIICLVLALFAFHLLPINYAGLALIILGIILMVSEAFAPSFGVLGLGGVISFIIGSIILIDTDVPQFEIYRPLIWSFAAASTVICVFVVSLALKAWKRPVVSGRESLRGAIATAAEDFERQGRVRLQGELWTATSSLPVQKGQRLQVTDMHGLRLVVEPVNPHNPKSP